VQNGRPTFKNSKGKLKEVQTIGYTQIIVLRKENTSRENAKQDMM